VDLLVEKQFMRRSHRGAIETRIIAWV